MVLWFGGPQHYPVLPSGHCCPLEEEEKLLPSRPWAGGHWRGQGPPLRWGDCGETGSPRGKLVLELGGSPRGFLNEDWGIPPFSMVYCDVLCVGKENKENL